MKNGFVASLAIAMVATSVASWAQTTAPDTSVTKLTTGFGELKSLVDARFFQFTAVVTDCPVPAGPFLRDAQRSTSALVPADPGDQARVVAADLKIATQLMALLTKGQLYTHSPLVNSSLWASVWGRIVTIEGCVAGDLPAGFDHRLIRTQLESLVSAVPGVLQAVVLIRTSAQLRANETVPYPVRP